jgi:hypothetical protein
MVSPTDQKMVQQAVWQERSMTVALYGYKNMLFLYYEALDDTLMPSALFPELTHKLIKQECDDVNSGWIPMQPAFFFANFDSIEEWERKEKKIRIGRIAQLLPDKIDSYLNYHQALVEEGLLDGDKYQSIALHEDILFSYFEEPKEFVHIKKTSQEPSKVIEEWLKADPESHFNHELSGKDNFLIIKEIFSFGREI